MQKLEKTEYEETYCKILWHVSPMRELLKHRNLRRHATKELCLRRMSVCCSLLDNSQLNN
jgi:hypothetical protein